MKTEITTNKGKLSQKFIREIFCRKIFPSISELEIEDYKLPSATNCLTFQAKPTRKNGCMQTFKILFGITNFYKRLTFRRIE